MGFIWNEPFCPRNFPTPVGK